MPRGVYSRGKYNKGRATPKKKAARGPKLAERLMEFAPKVRKTGRGHILLKFRQRDNALADAYDRIATCFERFADKYAPKAEEPREEPVRLQDFRPVKAEPTTVVAGV